MPYLSRIGCLSNTNTVATKFIIIGMQGPG